MTTAEPDREAQRKQILRMLGFMKRSYYMWFVIFVLLGIASVVLPGLAALGLWGASTGQALAGAGALSAAIFAFLKPDRYATGFDIASQVIWKALIRFDNGQIDTKGVTEELEKAIDATTFKYERVSTSGGSH